MRRALTLLIIFCAVFFAVSMSYASVAPNDTFYSKQWGIKAVHAPTVWEITTGSRNVNVAVIDTGIEPGHNDISGNLDAEKCRNFGGGILKPDESAYIDDDGHGTHVAGIIAARGNNSRGIAGMSWKANLIAIKGNKNLTAFIRSVNYITSLLEADPSMKIIVNISLVHVDKTPPDKASNESYELWQAMHELDQTGRALVCVAAGNNGINIGLPAPEASKVPGEEIKEGMYVYPAAFEGINNMIVVANAMRIGNGTEYSLYERSNYNKNKVHIAAPGTNIYSCISSKHDSEFDAKSHDLQADGDYLYARMDGTSMASPFVAGTAALLLSAYPEKSIAEIRSAILKGANAHYISDSTIYGFLDAKGAFDAMNGINVKAGIPVDDIQFPDEAFRNYIQENIDSNGDSRLDASEISATVSIDLAGLPVENLIGIKHFNNLEYLGCSGTKIEVLPVKEEIPNVNAIDASNCANLGAVLFDGLDQDGAKLVSLKVSGCTSLTRIECGSNDLEALDVSGCTALEELLCDYNKLTYLDVSGCPKLTELNCEYNSLTALDMHYNFTGTAEFGGQKRPLAMLHESSDGKIFSVDISGLIPAGKRDRVTNITASILSAAENDSQPTGISSHDGYNISYDSSRGIITITGKTPGSIPKPTRLRYVYKTESVCAMGVIVYIVSRADNDPEIPPYVPVSGKAILDSNTFPDPKFLAYVKKFDADNDGTLNEEEIKRIIRIGGTSFWNDKTRSYTGGTLDPSIESLKGIEYFTSITELECTNTNIQQIDVRNCKSLKMIHCGSCQLIVRGLPLLEEVTCAGVGNMDFSGCSSLKTLNITGNTLRKLNINGCISLDKFTYTVNESLEEIDAGGCISLKELSCYGSGYYNNHSPLYSIDISGCVALEKLDVSNSLLTELDISENASLKDLDISGNYLSEIDLSRCANLESLFCYKNRLSDIDLGKCPALVNLSCGENMLQSLDLSKNTALRSLFCNSNDIPALNLKNCRALERVNIAHNRIQALDLSGCPELVSIAENNIANNPVLSLDISGCAKIKDLHIYNPGILRSIKADGCISLASIICQRSSLDILSVNGCTSLESLYCGENMLASLDVTTCPGIKDLYCFGNRLEYLDVSGKTSLEFLICGANKLRGLKVSGCTALKTLYCYKNMLDELDLSGCGNLSSLECSENRLATLDLHGKISDLNGPQLSGQTISGMTLSENGGHDTPYHFDFRNLMSENDTANISSAQGRKGYDKVRTVLDGGIAYFEDMPTKVEYYYDTLKKYAGVEGDSKYLIGVTAEFSELETIPAEAPKITRDTLPDAILGEVYDETITFTGTAPVTWTLTEYDREIISLTAGYASRPFSKTGRLYGRPGRTGTYRFTVTVSNEAGNDTKTFTLNVVKLGENTSETPGNSSDNPGNTNTPGNADTPSANNAPSDELVGRLRNIFGTNGNIPVQNLTRNNASIYRERKSTGEYHSDGSKIAAILPEIQVSQEGIYIIPVSFDSPIPAGSYLAWHFFSDDIATAQNDGDSCVFLDSDSNELAMPLASEISGLNAAAYLEADTLYAPCVSYSSVEGGNNPGTSSGGGGGGCESFGFVGMILAAIMLIRRKNV